jgi:hypothetical protein
MSLPRRALVAIAGAACFAFTAAACGDSGSSTASDATTPPTTGGGATAAAGSLAGICPETVVIQPTWYPEAEYGGYYQLFGPGVDIEVDRGAVVGPLLDTGVDLELRSGGPFTGAQSAASLMYTDESIFMGMVSTDVAIKEYGMFPTVGVVAPFQIHPQGIAFDPATYDIDSWDDVKATGATILHWEDSPWVDYLVAEGIIDESQANSSYDGTPARFVADQGATMQYVYVSHEPYELENNTPSWNKEVDWLLVHDAGFEVYSEPLAVTPATLAEYEECIAALVPMIQQGWVDYMADPQAAAELMVEANDAFATFWQIDLPGTLSNVELMAETGMIDNGPTGEVGSFDLDRIQRMIDILSPMYEAQGVRDFDTSLTPADIATNEFIDPDISL